MEATDLSDVEVLDDLLNVVEEDEDAEFFDTDGPEADQFGAMTADNILSQLDAVTNLDDDDAQGDEFHDSTSAPASPHRGSDAGRDTTTLVLSEKEESGGHESVLQESIQAEQSPPCSGLDIVEAVLNLATSPDSDRSPRHDEAGPSVPDFTSEDEAQQENTPVHEQPPSSPTSTVTEDAIDMANCDEERGLENDLSRDQPKSDTIQYDNTSSGVNVESTFVTEVLIGDGPGIALNSKMLDTSVTDPPTSRGEGNVQVIRSTTDAQDIPTAGMHNNTEVATPPQQTVLPPPAPISTPVIVGSMNPVEDDNDSDDSQGEDEAESTLTPPLCLNDSDDDEDELEVDAAVVSGIQIEEQQRMSKRALSLEQQSLPTKLADNSAPDLENALLKALPTSNADDAIKLSRTEEIRAAHVTTLEPSGNFSDIHKLVGGAAAGVDASFGISYQNMRKKSDGPQDADDIADDGGYSLPSGPAFPDEREFEKELELLKDLSFSVAETANKTSGAGSEVPAASADDDEFAFDIQPVADSTAVSDDVLKARRESFEAQKRKEEEELLMELKCATDQEKRLIASNTVPAAAQPGMTATSEISGLDADAGADALSLTELHSIYKRGLGDQEVLMDDGEEKGTTSKGELSDPLGRSLSVMGRILSKPYGTETIAEAAEEEDGSEAEGNAEEDYPSREVVDMAQDYSEDMAKLHLSEDAAVDEPSEWREIKLVQHSRSQDIEELGSSPTVKGKNNLEAASVSKMTYAEAAGYYAETPDVMQHRDIIVPEDVPRGSCLGCLSRPRLTFPGAIEERDRVFCIAATAFDAHNDVVVGILQTVYRKITKNPRDVLLIGRHWEDIGFQGTDPSTDLRGCGVLSLLQMLYLVETHPDLAQRFHALSQHSTRHFAFACVLINITLQCVVALRSGALYHECNKHSSVLSGINRLYVSLAFHLHDAMQSRTDEIPFIMKDVLDRGKTNPGKAIDDAFDGPTLRLVRSGAAAGTTKSGVERKDSDDKLHFTEIGLHAADED